MHVRNILSRVPMQGTSMLVYNIIMCTYKQEITEVTIFLNTGYYDMEI